MKELKAGKTKTSFLPTLPLPVIVKPDDDK
jgi:hypothetical protein